MRRNVHVKMAIAGMALVWFGGLASGWPKEKAKLEMAGEADMAKASGSHPAGRPTPTVGGKLSPEDAKLFEERFTHDIWPLLSRDKVGCVMCHDQEHPSQLHFSTDGPAANFKKLFGQSFFDPENPSSLLARITSPVKERRMPPLGPWSDEEISRLRAFVNDLFEKTHQSAVKADEIFPAELTDPFTGKFAHEGPDNTFLTYRQLRGKIQTIFADDWRRNEHDMFNENIAQFGGADFAVRFNESSKASATFLSALDSLARDAASRAYQLATGPFSGRAENLPSPLKQKSPSVAYRAEITRLYRKLLYRNPTNEEMRSAYHFIRDIYTSAESVAKEENDLDFELVAEDGDGQTTSHAFRLRVTNEPVGLYQEYIDETVTPPELSQIRKKLSREFTFKPKSPGQRFEISNEQTSGNVSLAAIEIKGPLPETTVKRIGVTDPGVTLQGAWQLHNEQQFVSFEDGNNNKGGSRIEIPIDVPTEGRYELAVVWRRSGSAQVGKGKRAAPSGNAAVVPVEVHSHDKSVIASPPPPKVPPKGEAHFIIDETVDSIDYWDLKTAFRFGDGPHEGVEINNAGTRKRVVADSVKFVPTEKSAKTFVLDDDQAEGGWPKFKYPSFKPFNVVGAGTVTDNNEKKGEMRLLYKPSKSPDWQAACSYRVMVGFPGQVDNETQAPVIVHAQASTPIIQLARPLHADVGSTITLDASASYNLQGSPLKFTWNQIGGPRVKLSNRHAARVTATIAPMSPQQAAWEGLCRALTKHPDFLFTRPRSLAMAKDKNERQRLQLVKIAQDLVARPPTEAEIKQLERGAPLSKLIDQYLDSQEFKDFYFHRIRLVLESHGSESDDEPVRLWSYIAFNDHPFKEILTADYTVDTQFQKQTRPAYHGKTGLLTMPGFIKGKPGLPHFNYAAMVTEKFLGYVFEVPASIIAMRDGITAASTTNPTSVCYSCHKILTPLAYQRTAWDDDGHYKPKDGDKAVDDTDHGLVPSYPFRGKGMEAFAVQAANKERFIRMIFQTHFVMYFGREMRYEEDERGLYKRLWDDAQAHNFTIKSMLRALMTSSEYLNGSSGTIPPLRH